MAKCRTLLAVFAVPLLAGCAALKSTPLQDYVWETGRICDGRVAFWKMEEVKADGSYLVRGAANAPPGWHDYQACMREEFERRPYAQWLRDQPTSKPRDVTVDQGSRSVGVSFIDRHRRLRENPGTGG